MSHPSRFSAFDFDVVTGPAPEPADQAEPHPPEGKPVPAAADGAPEPTDRQ